MGQKKPSSKRIEHKDVVIPQLNHPTYISIYIDMRWGRKIERLLLEAKTEAETIEQEDETVSETIEQKLKLWESKGGEGEGTKPETMKQNVVDWNLNSCNRRE